MHLYRFGGDFLKFQHSYALQPIEESRLDGCLIDYTAIDALDRLIAGGLIDISDLHAVELALKGMIFHDQVSVIAPSAKLQVFSRGANQPFITSIYPPSASPRHLGPLQDDLKLTVVLGGVAQLLAFPEEDPSTFLQQYNEAAAARREQKRKQREDRGAPTPTTEIDPSTAPLELCAESEVDFFSNKLPSAPTMLEGFLRPIASSGHAAYVGMKAAREYAEAIRGQGAEQFFAPLDDTTCGC